jgi:hypothetical protein
MAEELQSSFLLWHAPYNAEQEGDIEKGDIIWLSPFLFSMTMTVT